MSGPGPGVGVAFTPISVHVKQPHARDEVGPHQPGDGDGDKLHHEGPIAKRARISLATPGSGSGGMATATEHSQSQVDERPLDCLPLKTPSGYDGTKSVDSEQRSPAGYGPGSLSLPLSTAHSRSSLPASASLNSQQHAQHAPVSTSVVNLAGMDGRLRPVPFR